MSIEELTAQAVRHAKQMQGAEEQEPPKAEFAPKQQSTIEQKEMSQNDEQKVSDSNSDEKPKKLTGKDIVLKTLAKAKKLQKKSDANEEKLDSIKIKKPKETEVLQADAQDQVMETTATQSLQQASSESKLNVAETQAAQQAEAIYEQQQAEKKSNQKIDEEALAKQALEIYEQEMSKMKNGQSSKDAAKSILAAITSGQKDTQQDSTNQLQKPASQPTKSQEQPKDQEEAPPPGDSQIGIKEEGLSENLQEKKKKVKRHVSFYEAYHKMSATVDHDE